MSSPTESALPPMVSYFHEGLGLSLQVPESWHGQLMEGAHFRILGPEQANFASYRPTMDIRAGVPDGQGDEWLKGMFAQAGEKMAASYPEFHLDREERFLLSSQEPVYVRHYRWRDQNSGLQFVQLQALMLQDAETLFLINAATLRPLEAEHMPIFETILHSFRLIPAETSAS